MLTLLLSLALLAPGPPPSLAEVVPPPVSPGAPLCRVTAVRSPDRIPGLTRLTLTVAPTCPPSGRAYVRFCSAFGGCVPEDRWVELRGDTRRVYVRAGTLPWWSPYWRAASGLEYRIPTQPPEEATWTNP